MKIKRQVGGFTLIELLIVIGIVIILSAIVILAIDPGFQLQRARNKQRQAHVSVLYGTINEYRAREGDYPACVTANSLDIIVCQEALVPDYLAKIPQDPDENCLYETGYFVKVNNLGIIGINAGCAELGDSIKVGEW